MIVTLLYTKITTAQVFFDLHWTINNSTARGNFCASCACTHHHQYVPIKCPFYFSSLDVIGLGFSGSVYQVMLVLQQVSYETRNHSNMSFRRNRALILLWTRRNIRSSCFKFKSPLLLIRGLHVAYCVRCHAYILYTPQIFVHSAHPPKKLEERILETFVSCVPWPVDSNVNHTPYPETR